MYKVVGVFCLIAAGIFAYTGNNPEAGAFCGGMATAFFLCGIVKDV